MVFSLVCRSQRLIGDSLGAVSGPSSMTFLGFDLGRLVSTAVSHLIFNFSLGSDTWIHAGTTILLGENWLHPAQRPFNQ